MILPKSLALAYSAAALLLPVTAQGKPDKNCVKTDQVQIAALFDDWNTALKSGNATTVAARYSSDAVLLPTLSDRVRTDDEGRIAYFNDFLKKKPEGSIDSRTLYIGCNMAIDTGLYTFQFENHPAAKARYTFTYAFLDDKWLITSHHSSLVPHVVSH